MSTGRDIFNRNKNIINLGVSALRIIPKSLRVFFWDCSSRYSQLPFVGLRYMILKSLSKSCGDNVRIGKNVSVIAWNNLSIGSNVSIHDNCYIDANGVIEINDNVSIAHNTSILSTNHSWVNPNIPIKYNPTISGKVVIDSDVWIGCGCRILAGVIINSRSVVAAGAVVNKSIPINSVCGGVPAKLIKEI